MTHSTNHSQTKVTETQKEAVQSLAAELILLPEICASNEDVKAWQDFSKKLNTVIYHFQDVDRLASNHPSWIVVCFFQEIVGNQLCK